MPQLAVSDRAVIDIDGGDSLRVVATYRHMGTASGATMGLPSGVQARCAAMYDKFAPIKKSVYASDKVTLLRS